MGRLGHSSTREAMIYQHATRDRDHVPDRTTGARPAGVAGFVMERVTGIEPAWPAWKAGALPLSYTRERRPVRAVEHT
jgi:hypothetical protein